MDVAQIWFQIYIVYILYNVMIVYAGVCLYKNSCTSRDANILFALLSVVCVFYNIDSDYYQYLSWFEGRNSHIADEHMEPIYIFIRNIIPGYFFIFRTIIWVSGIFVFKKVCELMNIQIPIALAVFAWLYTRNYAYARASLGIIICLFTYLCYLRAKEYKLLTKDRIKIVMLFVLSVSVHKSILGLWCIVICSYFLKYNKITLLVMALLYYPLTILLSSTIVNFFLSNFQTFEQFGYTEHYFNVLEQGEDSDRIGEMIHNLLPVSIFFCHSLLQINRCSVSLPYIHKKIIMAAISIAYISLLLFSIPNQHTLCYRFGLMVYPFMILPISYYIQEIRTKNVIVYSSILLFAFFYNTVSMYFYVFHNDPTTLMLFKYFGD